MSGRPERPRRYHDAYGWLEQEPGDDWTGYIVAMVEYIADKLDEEE